MSDPPRRQVRVDYTVDGIWRLKPEIIRQFIETDEDYSALCGEVAYILARATKRSLVETASITWRSKSLNSFLEKIQRKAYADPFNDITDRAGVRVVCHYESDCEVVADIVRSQFEVLESQDKGLALGTDRFGYSAHHLLVRLGERSKGARYDDLRKLVCEIQVRTVLQDAWAVLQHHLFYKSEERIPAELLRTVNALAALVEHVDAGFGSLREQRDQYLEQVRESRTDSERFLLNELTLETFIEYLRWKFPQRPVERSEGQVRRVVADLDRQRFRLLSDIDEAIVRYADEIVKIGNLVDTQDLAEGEPRPSVYDAVWAAALSDPRMVTGSGFPMHWREALRTIASLGQ
jgi:putative GTP pyrophosphokinase